MRDTELLSRWFDFVADAAHSAVTPPIVDTLKLGTFMYVKNVKWTKDSHSTDNPKYWVGRVAEIIRGGRVRLHWHRYDACAVTLTTTVAVTVTGHFGLPFACGWTVAVVRTGS